MELQKFTDPITGTNFSAPIIDGYAIINHAVTGEKVKMKVENGTISFPIEAFTYSKLIPSSEVCAILNITRQRLSQLVACKVLKPVQINGMHNFQEKAVLKYKVERKNGRPKGK